MVLEQGSAIRIVSFGNAIWDILLIVTGVTDRLTSATPRVGRQTGWSVVFYLFLITFTWVLVVPTLIAWAVVTYERAVAEKSKYFEQAALELTESNESSNVGNSSSSRRVDSGTEYNPQEEKGAVQIVAETLGEFASRSVWQLKQRANCRRRRIASE